MDDEDNNGFEGPGPDNDSSTGPEPDKQTGGTPIPQEENVGGALARSLVEHAGGEDYPLLIENAQALAHANGGTLYVTTHECDVLGKIPPTKETPRRPNPDGSARPPRKTVPTGTPAFILIDLTEGGDDKELARMFVAGRFKKG